MIYRALFSQLYNQAGLAKTGIDHKMSLFEKLLLTGFVISLHWPNLARAESQVEYHLTQPYGPPPVTVTYTGQVERNEVY